MRRTLLGTSLMLAMAVVMMLASAAPATAATVLKVDSASNTTAPPGGTIDYNLQITNTGTDPTDGTPITLTATLAPGLTFASEADVSGSWSCSGTTVVTCISTEVIAGTYGFSVPVLTVAVDPGATGVLTASFEVSGGGASNIAETADPTSITATAPSFGVDAFDATVASDATGNPFTQAAGHPYAASASIDFNTVTNPNPLIGELWPVEPPKDVLVDLPPGFVGNPGSGAAKCTAAELANADAIQSKPLCSPASQVGTTFVRIYGFGAFSGAANVLGPVPVFNVVPPPDVPARFGFNVLGTVVTLDASLRSASDYGLSVSVSNVPEGLPLAGTTLTFWGVPSDPSHDSERACPGQLAPGSGGPSCPTDAARSAFLRNPTGCTAPGVGLATTLYADSWPHPGNLDANGRPDLSDPSWQKASFVSHNPPGYPAPPDQWGGQQGPTGCGIVPFAPTLSASPASPARAGIPSGFKFDVNLPQNSDPDAIGEADLKKAVVTLPEGVRVSPSSADGLGACTPDEIGLHSVADPTCPESSKVGSLTIDTPLLEQQLTGGVYLASPHNNPFNSLIAIYLAVRGPGVVIKLPGKVTLDPNTGQITTTFDNQPQLPFSNLHLELNGGARSPLVTPNQCGTYTTHSVLTSWSGKTVSSDSSFTLSADGNGAPCSPTGFSPGLSAGTVNPKGGVFTPFGLQLQRTDRDQEFGSLRSLSLPPGLLADVGSVSIRCTEDQARAAACPAASHIGTVMTGAGAGPDPFYVPGDVYLMGGFGSGPFKGDPFGLAVVVHALAGPFDLGYVVVEAGVQVHDDGSISSQTEPFPSILQGIPLQLKDIRLNLDRPNFILTPTNCSQMAVAGSVVSTEGMVAPVSSRFQVGECAALGFKPSFTVSTAGKTSKANGASLHVHVGTHEGPSSTGAAGESNIAKVEVELPGALPSRLTTLQKACTAAQFGADPAGCPQGAFVGTAVARTPILSAPLSGPAILVSHGGAAFPDLVLVLQGEGVRIVLTGHTQIKKGVTFSRFETVPDAPISSFELNLPRGRFSALAATTPLCGRTVATHKRITRRVHGRLVHHTRTTTKRVPTTLLMPTTITGQNGVVLHQNTKIAVTGCPAPKAKRHKKAKTGGRGRR